jgi:hypothetical protein
MRESSFASESARCRQLATEYKGRSEARFLISIADAFQDLKDRQLIGQALKKAASACSAE